MLFMTRWIGLEWSWVASGYAAKSDLLSHMSLQDYSSYIFDEALAQVYAPHASYECINAETAEGKACAACAHRFARKST